MEMIIIVCLITVIALLLHDKLGKSKSGQMDNIALSKDDKYSNDIIGKPKSIERMSQKNSNLEGMSEQISLAEREKTEIDMESFDLQQINHSVEFVPDFEDEEEELRTGGAFYENNKFATGVTFAELGNLDNLLRQDILEPVSQNHAIEIINKLEGTELLSLLESSINNASKKIAKLLDTTSGDTENTGFHTKNIIDRTNFNISDLI
jgi:hypothetical protein